MQEKVPTYVPVGLIKGYTTPYTILYIIHPFAALRTYRSVGRVQAAEPVPERCQLARAAAAGGTNIQ